MHHPTIVNILRFSKCDHLPPELRVVAEPFAILAHQIAGCSPLHPESGPETTVALRKLLEAKDAAVRACLPTDEAKTVTQAAREGFRS